MTLSKADIANEIVKLGYSKTESIRLLETILEIIKHTLENGEDVLITGFGKFCVKDKRQRRGRNPQTGGQLTLSARRVVTFKCSAVLQDRINGKR